MKYLWIMLCLSAVLMAGYYYHTSPPKPKPSAHQEVHETKAILMSKIRDHEALWIHYKYTDTEGNGHEWSEKVPYIDLWEKLSVGQEVDILYNDEGISVLKIVAHKRGQAAP